MIGETISHYRVLDLLGSGGMGVVYKAQDLTLQRTVALKFLPAEWAGDRIATERFMREARTAASLNHPNICTVHEVGEHQGAPFIAMELLEGQTLDQLISGQPIESASFLDLAVQITEALDAAHTKGILHRDIKPSNIFVTPARRVKVLDFGLAKLAPLEAGGATGGHTTNMLTIGGGTMGTVLYMSPEQARGEELDARSDIFSCGVTLYEMATGRQTFGGGTTAVVFDAILNRDPVPISSLNTAVSPELERIIDRALEKDRDLRYQSAADLRADLQRLKRDRESGRTRMVTAVSMPAQPAATATVMPSVASAPVARKRPSWEAIFGIVGVICLGASLVFFFWNRNDAPAVVASSQPEAVVAEAAPAAAAAPEPAVAQPAQPVIAPAAPAAPAATAKASSATATVAAAARATGSVPSTRPDAAATDMLGEARKNFDARQYDQTLVSLKAVLDGKPSATVVSAASLLTARTYERLGRLDEALTTCTSLRKTEPTGTNVAECSFLMANLIMRSKRPDRETAALALYGDVAIMAPKGPFGSQALAAKAALEDRRKLRLLDPQLNTSVPAALVSYRTLVGDYPSSPEAEDALWKLSEMYDDLKRYALAADSLEVLATHFPNNTLDAWWRAGEMWAKKAKDPARAREAYARVPAGSKRYRDAQERLRQ